MFLMQKSEKPVEAFCCSSLGEASSSEPFLHAGREKWWWRVQRRLERLVVTNEPALLSRPFSFRVSCRTFEAWTGGGLETIRTNLTGLNTSGIFLLHQLQVSEEALSLIYELLSESAQFVHQCHVIGLEHECFHSQYLNCGYLWTTGKWSETGSAGQPWWDVCWTLASGRWTGFATETQKRQPPPQKKQEVRLTWIHDWHQQPSYQLCF